MHRQFAPLAACAALLLVGACGSPPTQQEANLDQRATHPEVLPGGDTDQAAPPGAGNQLGTQEAGGPVSDQGSSVGDAATAR